MTYEELKTESKKVEKQMIKLHNKPEKNAYDMQRFYELKAKQTELIYLMYQPNN